MRVIKFRLWDSTLEEFDHKSSLTKMFELVGRYPNNYIVSQYIELKDKNGVEIYEGDLVKFMHGIGEVVFDMSDASFGIKRGNLVFPLYTNVNNLEVVGNIYDA